MKPITIDLNDFGPFFRPMIIARAPTNVLVTAQAGGFACLHPECEGFLIPAEFAAEVSSYCDLLCRVQDYPYHAETTEEMIHKRQKAVEIIDKRQKAAEIIDKDLQALQLGPPIKGLRFDYDNIEELTEAWIPIEFKFCFKKHLHLTETHEYQPMTGILVTSNCD